MIIKPYVPMHTSGGDYQLKLSTAAAVELESRTGKSLIDLLENTKAISVQVELLHAALQKYHHGISLTDACGIYDDYIACDGCDMTTLMSLLMDVLTSSGFIRLPETETQPTQETQPQTEAEA